jgi:hypothetical protein
MESAMTRADELRAEARTLYQQAQSAELPDETLLHLFHAIELETEADDLERDVLAANITEFRAREAA